VTKKKMPYPPFEPNPSCPLCGETGDHENEHNTQTVLETHKDLSVSLYVQRSCGRCGYSWAEQSPTPAQKKARGSEPVVGFGNTKEE